MSDPGPSDSKPASYRFTDTSLIRPAMTRLWFARLFPLLPRWLAANLVTLSSTASLIVVFVMSLGASQWSPTVLAVVFFVAQQVYLAGDHLDGMQAVATGTTSPLGDFLDHFCDLWAGGILIYGFWALLGTAAPAAMFISVALLILAFAATYTEREERRTLHFAALGALEGNLIVSAFWLSFAIAPVRAWWQSKMFGGLAWYYLMIWVAMAIGAGTVLVIWRRLGRFPPTFAIFSLAIAALTVFAVTATSLRPVYGWFLLVVYGADYVARVMHGYLIPGSRSRPSAITTTWSLALAAWVVVGEPDASLLFGVCAAYATVCFATLIFTLSRIFRSLRRHWVWINKPAMSPEGV